MEEIIDYLINFLLDEMPMYREDAKRIDDPEILLRSLMNVRPPMALNTNFLTAQDKYLSHLREVKGVVDIHTLPEIQPHISLWQGDITRLNADAIVNAANSKLLGCFIPCHNCIDNAIHSAAGLQLRDECYKIMQKQGHDEPVGQAKITGAYNLPCKHVIHTVGPQVGRKVTDKDREDLASCYRSCIKLADSMGLESIVFCCISTGEFHFPNYEAATIAVRAVNSVFYDCENLKHVTYDVFTALDEMIYQKVLSKEMEKGKTIWGK